MITKYLLTYGSYKEGKWKRNQSTGKGMGTKVQLDNYYSMRDLNHDSNGTSWPSCGENNLPNGQYYYGVLPSSSPDSYLGADKDLLKRKMLEHETVFQNQVFELHRVYRVQRDLMDELRKKEEFKNGTPCEASSSSSPLASQAKLEDAHRRKSSSFLFSNSNCVGSPVTGPEFIGSSAGGSQKGKNVQEGGPGLFQNCASPRNSEVSESRPSKLRKVIDLQLPPEEYLDAEEVGQCGNGMTADSHHCENTKYEEVASKSSDCLRKPNTLADLNEPPDTEEPIASSSVDFLGIQNQVPLTKVPCPADGILWKSNYGNIYGPQNNFRHNDEVSQESWFSSGLKQGVTNDNEKFINQSNHPQKESLHSRSLQVVFENRHQPHGMFGRHHVNEDWPAKATAGFTVFDKRCFSNFNNSGEITPSHGKQSSFLSQKPISVQTNPFLGSGSLSKSSQSPIQSDFPGSWLHKNNGPISNPGYGSKASARNGFHHGTSSDGCKELSASFPNASLNYVNGSYNDKAASGSCAFLQGRNAIDLNSTRDLNLNVAIPNGLSDESVVPQIEANREDPVSVLPWLRGKISNQAVSSRTCPDKSRSGLLHDQGELFDRSDVRNAIDHQDAAAASASCNVDATKGKSHVIIDHPSSSNMILGITIHQVPLSGEQEIDSRKKKLLFDINMPCDDLEEAVEDDKVETKRLNSVRHMIDLNSCFTEDEIPSSPTTNDMKRPKRCIIDLEAPADVEDDEAAANHVVDEEVVRILHQLPSCSSMQQSADSSDEILARGAAEAIITLSSSVCEERVNETSEDALRWFVDIVCACPNADDMDCTSSESDYLEEMTLKLTECSVDEYFPDRPNFEIPTVEESGTGIVMGRARRGPARRGRQKRDFQRDILPGLTSLARNEVTEDLQMFGGLMRATGHAWDCGSRRNSSRNGSKRGRRKAVATIPSSSPCATASPAVTDTTGSASYQKLFATNGEVPVTEDRSLGSWGKTTRRPRRQRCPAGVAEGRKGSDT